MAAVQFNAALAEGIKAAGRTKHAIKPYNRFFIHRTSSSIESKSQRVRHQKLNVWHYSM
jgi:hypothetical protein